MTDDTIDIASSRKAAKANGLRFYAGAPCAAHPAALRYVASKACVECAKAARKRNVDTVKDRDRKRLARAADRERFDKQLYAAHSSIICELVGI